MISQSSQIRKLTDGLVHCESQSLDESQFPLHMDLFPRFLVWVCVGVSLWEKAAPWVALSVDPVSCVRQTNLRIILRSAECRRADIDCALSEIVATVYSLVAECSFLDLRDCVEKVSPDFDNGGINKDFDQGLWEIDVFVLVRQNDAIA